LPVLAGWLQGWTAATDPGPWPGEDEGRGSSS
jgi:hypothetical protein